MSKRLSAGIAIVITAVWVLSSIARFYRTNYSPSPGLDPLMLIVAGAAFRQYVSASKGGKDKDDD